MNIRELCRLLSATLHLPGVDRWVEQLVRRELLPGLDSRGQRPRRRAAADGRRGRSAHELMQQGREHLFTRAEIAGMRALETPEFRKAFNEYQDWNQAILDFAEAKGG